MLVELIYELLFFVGEGTQFFARLKSNSIILMNPDLQELKLDSAGLGSLFLLPLSFVVAYSKPLMSKLHPRPAAYILHTQLEEQASKCKIIPEG